MFSFFFFQNWIARSTTFRTVSSEIISGKRVSSASHALEALLLAPETVEAWKFAGGNSKGFSPINVPN